jgi:hypothetical protein
MLKSRLARQLPFVTRTVKPLGAVLLCCWTGWAANPSLGFGENPEEFKIEVTGSAWLVNSAGTIQANGAPVDLVTDLGAQQQQPTFYGQLVIKPGRKHRIVLEGTPFRITGYNTITRTVTYRGETFNVSETLQSSADLNYFFAGYQYDVLSSPAGHLGFSVGGAYANATGTIHGVQTGVTASKSETVGLPLAGLDFRIFPIARHKILDIDGGIRGMGFGSYGHYVEATGNGGICLGPFTLLAGYRAVNVDLHETGGNGSGVSARLKGPIFSAVWRW